MVISRTATREFLNRPRRDCLSFKSLSDEALDKRLEKRGVKFHTPPYRHQKICVLLGLKYGSFLFLPDPGLGKSKISLDLIAHLDGPALILVPSITNVGGWEEETKVHRPELSFIGLTGKKEERLEALEQEADIVCVTYQGWLRLVCSKRKKRGRRTKKKTQIDPKKARRLERRFKVVIFDESSDLKSHLSLTFQACRRLSKTAKHRFCLTGTPIDKSPIDFWTQLFIVDHGESLGESLSLYREGFFTEEKLFWGGSHWVFKDRKKPLLKKMIRHSSIRFRDSECLDLPPMVGGILGKYPMIRPVTFTDEQWTYYEKLVERARESQGDEAVIESTYTQCRQVASGYLQTEDGPIIFEENPKMEALIELLREIPDGRQVLVYNHFKQSGELICERLKKEKIKHVRVFSGTKDKIKAVADFKSNPKIKVLVGSRSICKGLNLQVANYLIVFESPDSMINRIQLEKRIQRPGQKFKCFVWDLVMKGSVEPRIFRYVKAGKDLFVALVDGSPAELLVS